MLPYIIVILIGLVGGAAVGIQGPIAGAMAQRIGGISSSFIVHLSGMLLSGLLLFIRGGEKIRDWQSLPWYMLFSGAFGVILYLTISVTLPRLGGTLMIALIIIGELLVGVLIDHFGWLGVPVHPANLARGCGLALLLVAVYLIGK